jgi:hypothetical protein
MRKLMVNRTAFLALMAAVLVLLAGAFPAKADTLYTTGGSPLTYIADTGYTTVAGGLTVAIAFAPTTTGALTDLIVPLGSNQGGTGSAPTFYIESSTAGAPSGTILDTLTTTSTIADIFLKDALYTYTCSPSCANPTLTAGTTYFLVDAGTSAGLVNWDDNSLIPNATVFANFTGSTSTGFFSLPLFQPVFQIDGAVATPEPSSLLLLGMGLLGLAVIGRKKLAAGSLS